MLRHRRDYYQGERKQSAFPLLLVFELTVRFRKEQDAFFFGRENEALKRSLSIGKETSMAFPDFLETISIVIILTAIGCPPFRRTNK